MKNNLTSFVIMLLLFTAILSSCNKQDSFGSTQSTTTTVDPSVTSWKAYPVYTGATQHIGFDVVLDVPASNVKRVVLYMNPSYLRWYVDAPKSGKYIMYDQISDFPTYAEGRWYHFEFEMNDGTIKVLPKFQVY